MAKSPARNGTDLESLYLNRRLLDRKIETEEMAIACQRDHVPLGGKKPDALAKREQDLAKQRQELASIDRQIDALPLPGGAKRLDDYESYRTARAEVDRLADEHERLAGWIRDTEQTLATAKGSDLDERARALLSGQEVPSAAQAKELADAKEKLRVLARALDLTREKLGRVIDDCAAESYRAAIPAIRAAEARRAEALVAYLRASDAASILVDRLERAGFRTGQQYLPTVAFGPLVQLGKLHDSYSLASMFIREQIEKDNLAGGEPWLAGTGFLEANEALLRATRWV
jgi:hypothetical protein